MRESFLESLEDELNYIGVDTDLALYNTILDSSESTNQANLGNEYVIEERTDRPTVVKGGKLWFSRPLEEFTEAELDIVYNEAISDVLAFEAGVYSPNTYTQSDFDEFEELFEMEGLDSEPEEYLVGSDNIQKRVNASLLMRHYAENIRFEALKLQDTLQQVEDYERAAKALLFESEESHFKHGNAPTEYNELLMSLVDLSEGMRSLEQVEQNLEKVIAHPTLKGGSKDVFVSFGDRIPQISYLHKFAKDEKELARNSLESKYDSIFDEADKKLLAASLFYQINSTEGQNRMRSVNNRINDNISSLDFVDEEIIDNFDVLREYLVDKSFRGELHDNGSNISDTVKEFLGK